VDEHHPELCLRSLVLIEQLACPATMPGDPGTVLVGPLPGQPIYAGAPNTAVNFQTKFVDQCPATLEPVPLRLLLGTAEVKRDASGAVTAITPMPAPMGFESPATEYVPLRKDPLTGQLFRTEIWDYQNWTPGKQAVLAARCADLRSWLSVSGLRLRRHAPDAHPPRVPARPRPLRGALPARRHEHSRQHRGLRGRERGTCSGRCKHCPKHASCADTSLRSAQLLCDQAYWEYPSYPEIHAVKDTVRVDPGQVWASPTKPPPANPNVGIYDNGKTYAQFHADNARPLAPFTETFKPKCVPFTRVLAVRTRSPRACHVHADA
jgi:hypothetical protein